MSNCPCGLDAPYESCCGQYHAGEAQAPTAEALMRSRYSAYVKQEIDYLSRTIPLTERRGFDRRAAREWAQSAEWQGLEILSTKDNPDGKRATVEFAASFKQEDETFRHHEVSRFEKVQDRWFYIDGEVIPETEDGAPGVSRNAPCPCGSGKKYKRCCAAKS